ncbi:MAG: hypothetical protein ACM33V_10135, partial [Chloroflexota bacterium]
MGSLRSGFDVVSKHVGLILVPAALDVLLWLGPRLSADVLMAQARKSFPTLENLQKFIVQVGAGEPVEHVNLFNLLSRLPLFPVGVSSLLAQKVPLETPF